MKRGELRIKIKAEDVNCNPDNVAQMTEEQILAEHHRRAALDPGAPDKPGMPPKAWIYHDQVSYEDELETLWGKKWGAQGIGKLREVFLNPPCNTEMRMWAEAKHARTQYDSSRVPDIKRWQEQYEGMVKAYRDNGVLVHELIVPDPVIGPYGLTKWIWAMTDAAIVINGGAIIPRPGYFGRQKGRNPLWQRALAELGVPIIYAVRGKGVAEIGGCIWLDDQHFIVEDGTIMNREGINQLKPIFAMSNAKLVVLHSPGYYENTEWPAGGTSHTDMIVAIPNIGLAVVAPYMCDFAFIKFLKRIEFDIIEVPPEEYNTAVYNMVNLEPGKVLCPAGAEKTIKAMENWGIKVVAIPFDECMKAGGGIHCSTCQLVRDPGPLVPALQKTPLEELAPELL